MNGTLWVLLALPPAAGAVLLVGVGPKAEFTVDAARRALGRAAGTARRFGTVATTFPTVFSAKQAADAVGASIEGLGLGAYRFDRYRTKKADGKDLPITLSGSEEVPAGFRDAIEEYYRSVARKRQ